MDQLVLEDAEGPWLVARGVEVDGRRLSLPSGLSTRNLVAAKRIEVARPPKPGNQPAAEGGSGSLPVDITIKALNLPDIALGEAVTGWPGCQRRRQGQRGCEGVAAVGAIRPTVARTDGTPAKCWRSLVFAPDQNKLDIDLKASEPSGGFWQTC